MSKSGGAPSVDAAVDIFYRKVLSDDRISRFFDDVDMDRQAAKQKAFLTMVLGGPASYTGLDMRARRAAGADGDSAHRGIEPRRRARGAFV